MVPTATQTVPRRATTRCSRLGSAATGTGSSNWAAGYNACYKDENVTDVNGAEVKSEFEHYTFCPEGSEYVPAMQRYYAEHEMHRTGFPVPWGARLRGGGGGTD